MKRAFVFIIKFMPIIQLVGIFILNIVYYINKCDFIYHLFNYLLGNSILTITFLFIASKIFGLCKWHRICIYGNVINITISAYDKIFHIPVSNLEMLVIYSTISILFLFIALYYKFKCKNHETSIETISERIAQCCR